MDSYSNFDKENDNQSQFLTEIEKEKFIQIARGHGGTVILKESSSLKVLKAVKNKMHLGKKSCLKVHHNKICEILNKEYNLMKEMQHPYILKYKAFKENTQIQNQSYCAIETEFCQADSYDFFIKQRNVSFQDSISIIKKILHGVYFLHENDITHNDIKLENILIDSELNPKIADFGTANKVNLISSEQQYINWNERNLFFAGPEVFKFLQQFKREQLEVFDEKKSDIFALGQSIFFIVFKMYPRLKKIPNEECELYREIMKQDVDAFLAKIEKQICLLNAIEQAQKQQMTQFIILIMMMMHPVPQQRPNINEILDHEIFQQQEPIKVFN